MVIYLNGPINAGKTTVSKLLAAMIENSVVIEIDDLPVPDHMSLEQSIKLLLEDAVDLARSWHERGYHPIVVWPISPEDHAEFVERLADSGAMVFTFTLAPKYEAAITNRGSRDLTDWERERIKYHYSASVHSPLFGTIIDNTSESPQQTADRIIQMLPDL